MSTHEVSSRSEKVLTADQLVELARVIFQYVRGLPLLTDTGSPEASEQVRMTHAQFPDFAQQFPLALNWMIFERYLSEAGIRAAVGYLARIHHAGRQPSFDDQLEAQAIYMRHFFRDRNPRAQRRTEDAFVDRIRAGLKKERKIFQTATEEEQKEQAEIDKKVRARLQVEIAAAAAQFWRPSETGAPVSVLTAPPAASTGFWSDSSIPDDA